MNKAKVLKTLDHIENFLDRVVKHRQIAVSALMEIIKTDPGNNAYYVAKEALDKIHELGEE